MYMQLGLLLTICPSFDIGETLTLEAVPSGVFLTYKLKFYFYFEIPIHKCFHRLVLFVSRVQSFCNYPACIVITEL